VYLKEEGLIDQLLVKYKVGPIDSGASAQCEGGGVGTREGSEENQMEWSEMSGNILYIYIYSG